MEFLKKAQSIAEYFMIFVIILIIVLILIGAMGGFRAA